jgi:phage FluMu protein Com
MPIEFQCSHCEHVLKVADEHAGKSARCPSCKTIIPIPMASTHGTSAFDLAEEPTEQSGQTPANPSANPYSNLPTGSGPADAPNPYQAPTATKLENKVLGSGEINPTSIDIDSILTDTWDLYKVHWLFLLGATVVVTIGSVILNLVFEAVNAGLEFNGAAVEMIIAATIFFQLLSQLVSTFFGIGMVKICLRFARRQNVQFIELFTGGNKLLPVFLVSIIVVIIVVLGLAALIVPGVIAMLTLWPFFHLIVDEKAGAVESISIAYSIGRRNKLTSLVIVLMCLGLGIAGCLAACVGLFFVSGFINLLYCVAYLKMTGQMR